MNAYLQQVSPMDQIDASLRSSTATYRSGVAARLAGVPVETLRVWERRYGVISPRKSASGQRLYSADEVRRLTLIKQLLDLGHPIGTVATVPTEDLIHMFSAPGTGRASDGIPGLPPSLALHVLLVGPTVSSDRFRESLLRNASDPALHIVGHAMTAESFVLSAKSVAANLVIIEMPTLSDGSIAAINRIVGSSGADKAIVLYRFAPSNVIRHLRQAGHEVAHALSDTDELAALCQALVRLPHSGIGKATGVINARPLPPRRFDEQALAAFAAAPSAVYCECPRHLIELVLSLSAFERYSAECVSRGGPEDVELHQGLLRTAAQARALIEEAICQVAATEGISLQSAV